MDEEIIAGLVGGAIDSPGLADVEAHLARCPTCRELVAAAGYGAIESAEDGIPISDQPRRHALRADGAHSIC